MHYLIQYCLRMSFNVLHGVWNMDGQIKCVSVSPIVSPALIYHPHMMIVKAMHSHSIINCCMNAQSAISCFVLCTYLA